MIRTERMTSLPGFVLKLALSLSLVGFVLAEGAQIVLAQLRAQDAARAAAEAAAGTLHWTRNHTLAGGAAGEAVRAEDPLARLDGIEFHRDGSVTVTVAGRADTMLADRVSFLHRFTVHRATERAAYSP